MKQTERLGIIENLNQKMTYPSPHMHKTDHTTHTHTQSLFACVVHIYLYIYMHTHVNMHILQNMCVLICIIYKTFASLNTRLRK